MNIIFVAGLPRSGTTMIQNILDTHPHIYGGGEFDRISNIIDLRRKLHASFDSGRLTAYTSKTVIDKSIRTLIESLLVGIKSDKKIEFISEKTPWNILVFRDLMELFPDAKFVHVLRNPVDVYNSMKQVARRARLKGLPSPDFTKDPYVAIDYMLSVYAQCTLIEKSNPSNYLVVRYEDVVADTESASRRLCEFIGVDWSDELLNFYRKQHPGENSMIGKEVWYNAAMFNADPSQKSKSENSSLLNFSEAAMFHKIFSNNSYLRSHKYDVAQATGFLQKLIGTYHAYRINRKIIPGRRTIRVLG